MAQSTRETLPKINEDLERAQVRPNLRKLQSKAGVDEALIEENSRKIGTEWNANTSLNRDTPAEQGPERAKTVSLRIDVPDYLMRELSLAAAGDNVTKQFVVLKALRNAGFRLDDVDLVEDGRRARTRKDP